VPRALPSLRVGSNRSNARPTTFTTISHLSHREFAINHLILFGILWSLAISVGSAQEQPPAANAESPIGVGPAVSEAASQEKPTGATPEGGSQSRGPSRPGIDADGNGIVDQVEIDRMPSFLRDWLHKRDVSLRAGMTIDETKAAFKAAREVPAGEIRIFALKNSQATSTTDLLLQLFTAKPFRADADELHNSVVVTGSAEQLQAVEALLLKLDEAPRELSAKPEQDGKSAVGEDPSKTPQQQVAELRTDYETANRQARDLAESLRQTPDAAKKAELRTAVQRTFTLRQSLLRAELQEMKARLLQTQQSLDTRERIADQIVDRRVEDLLNPKLKWDDDKDSIDTTGPMTSTTDALQKPATTAPVTELEGDWHLVSITDKAGDPVEVRPINLSFRNDRYTLVYQGDQIDRRVEVYPDQKEIRYFADGNDSFSRTQYLLISDELTIDGESQKRVYHRGHVRIPRSIPKATDEQKSRWRSGIVDIIAQQANAATSDQKRIGYGVIVSPQMVIVAQLKLSDGDWSFFAKFDDGGIVSIKIVEEGPQGWVTFQPEQSIEVNHHFQLSTSAVGQYDEVNFWGRSAKLSDQPTPELFTTTVTALDRKSPALGLALWQLLSYDKLDGSLPILDDHGNVLAIALIGTGDLFLAVPVSQLKTIFPKSLGQLTDTQTSAELSTAPDSEPAQPFAEN